MQAGRRELLRRAVMRHIGASGPRFPSLFDVGREYSRAATHVESYDERLSDAGSTPAASTSPRSARRTVGGASRLRATFFERRSRHDSRRASRHSAVGLRPRLFWLNSRRIHQPSQRDGEGTSNMDQSLESCAEVKRSTEIVDWRKRVKSDSRRASRHSAIGLRPRLFGARLPPRSTPILVSQTSTWGRPKGPCRFSRADLETGIEDSWPDPETRSKAHRPATGSLF